VTDCLPYEPHGEPGNLDWLRSCSTSPSRSHRPILIGHSIGLLVQKLVNDEYATAGVAVGPALPAAYGPSTPTRAGQLSPREPPGRQPSDRHDPRRASTTHSPTPRVERTAMRSSSGTRCRRVATCRAPR